MVQYQSVVSQLQSLGMRFQFFGKPELRELCKIINEDEVIRHACYGYYEGGTALLVATDMRLLLIDKKIIFLNLEDIRYEMINDVTFSASILYAVVRITAGSTNVVFKALSDARLRNLCNYVQNQITLLRQPEQDQAQATTKAWRQNAVFMPRRKLGKFSVSQVMPRTQTLPK